MSLPSHADVIVPHRRPGPSLRPGDLVAEGVDVFFDNVGGR